MTLPNDLGMTLTEVARMSGMTVEGLRLAITNGRLMARKDSQGWWRITEADFAAYQKHAGNRPDMQGERNHLHRLTARDVEEIRQRYATKDPVTGRRPSIRDLAADYHVGKTAIHRVVRGQTWKQVNDMGQSAPLPQQRPGVTRDAADELGREWEW